MTSGIPVEDWIAHHARFSPGAEAAHDLASSRRFTYAQFDERVTRAALWLAAAFGVRRGDRVAVLSMNDTDVFELQKHITRDDLPEINRQHVEAFYRCD